MKKTKHWGNRIALFMMMVMPIIFTACSENDAPEVSSASVKVSVKIDKAFEKRKPKRLQLPCATPAPGKKQLTKPPSTARCSCPICL